MGTDAHRTPDERFAALPGFPHEPAYREWEGLRLAHVDVRPDGPAGDDAPVVLLVHGEPTWSFLWRDTITRLVAEGFRCVAPDHAGFGRSDKPTDVGWYSYARHVDALVHLVDHLDLRDATLVCHDWGGPIGLRVATVDRPERFARIAAMDTGVFDGHQRMSDAWHHFAAFVARVDELPIGRLITGACTTELSPEVVAAYEAPFDVEDAKAGARAFPPLIPQTPDAPGADHGAETAAALATDARPQLVLWGADDPVLPPKLADAFRERLMTRAAPPTLIPGASHFVSEDAGDEVGRLVAAWIAAG